MVEFWNVIPMGGIIVAPSASSTAFVSGFAGGGGQASNDVSPFNADHVLAGTDTGGIRVSRDGLASSAILINGYDKLRSKQADGVKWSRVTEGRVFMTCGDGTSGVGGVYVATNAHTANPSKWKRLDGVAGIELIFNGGNSGTGDARTPISGNGYPRHYGRTIEIDESSIAGHTLIHVATTADGAWRIKMRNSDLTAIEQVQYAGTAGTYVRCLQMACYAPNDANNNYSRILLSTYNRSSPIQPVLCTNANDSGVSPALSTATVTAAPTNVEAMGYIKTSTGQAVTIYCSDGDVRLSINSFSAATGSIAMTSVARTEAQGDGPETTTKWISVGTTHNGSNYVILVGTFGGKGAGNGSTGSWNTVWRGVVSEASSTPWSAIIWTPLAGSTYWSEQIMNRPGTDNDWWLSGSNTPGMNGSAAVSAFTTSKTDPSRMYAVSRGNAYRSDNFGLNWYASDIFGSADHSSIMFWREYDTDVLTTTTGDWTLAGTMDQFATEPNGILLHLGNTNCSFPDPKTGECFIGGGLTGTTIAPAVDNDNTLWGIPYSQLSLVSSSSTVLTDYNLNTGSGANISVGQPMGGICVYGNGGAGTTRAIIVATQGGQGLWYTKNNGTSWLKIAAITGAIDPFSTSGYEYAPVWWDKNRNVVYLMDRGNGRVWRVGISTDGTVSNATCIFGDSWTYAASKEGIGYIDTDLTNNRLWVATANGAWYIDNASTALENTAKGNATATPAATEYPGEIFGPMCFLPASGAVCVATMGFTSNQLQKYEPSLNGADGCRFLHVTTPTTGTSWNLGTAEDWTVTRDRGYRMGYITPHGISRNALGTKIAVSMQGNGVGLWTV